MLWCLDPSDKWKPKDIDIVIFQPSPAQLPFFIDEKKERDGKRNLQQEVGLFLTKSIGNLTQMIPKNEEEEKYLRALFWRNQHLLERKMNNQWMRIQCSLPALYSMTKVTHLST